MLLSVFCNTLFLLFLFKFSDLSELLEYQHSNYVFILKENNILEEELEKIIIKEYDKLHRGISAEEYLNHVLKEDIK